MLTLFLDLYIILMKRKSCGVYGDRTALTLWWNDTTIIRSDAERMSRRLASNEKTRELLSG